MADVIKILNKLEDFNCLEGADERAIISAETNLGVKFASDHKKYLSEYGLASADGHEFTGIVKSPRLNVVDVTIRLKKKFKNVPNDAYVLEELNIDDIVIFKLLTETYIRFHQKHLLLRLQVLFQSIWKLKQIAETD